jgi:hypothetical protein
MPLDLLEFPCAPWIHERRSWALPFVIRLPWRHPLRGSMAPLDQPQGYDMQCPNQCQSMPMRLEKQTHQLPHASCAQVTERSLIVGCNYERHEMYIQSRHKSLARASAGDLGSRNLNLRSAPRNELGE